MMFEKYITIRRIMRVIRRWIIRAVKLNFSLGEIERWLEPQDVYTLHRHVAQKISAIALQRNKH